jgi:hypothetical protein
MVAQSLIEIISPIAFKHRELPELTRDEPVEHGPERLEPRGVVWKLEDPLDGYDLALLDPPFPEPAPKQRRERRPGFGHVPIRQRPAGGRR